MNVLITGGAGYIGSSLVDKLAEIDAVQKIVVYDNLNQGKHGFFFGKQQIRKLQFIHGDILDAYAFLEALKGIDTVIHLAAYVAQPYNHLQSLQYEQINRLGTQNVSRLCQESTDVKRFLYLSSSAVYGFHENILAEDTPMPDNAYSQSKFAAEEYVRLMTKPFAIVRSGNVFGFNPSIRLDTVLNAFFFDAITKGKIKIYGNGKQQRPFISLENIVSVLYRWVLTNESPLLAVDFNASINDLRDFLNQREENVEYQYLNQNQNFSGQSIKEYHKRDVMEELLNKFYEELKNNVKVIAL